MSIHVVHERGLGVLLAAGLCAGALSGCGSSQAAKGDGSGPSQPSGSSSGAAAGSGSAEEAKSAQQVLADSRSALFEAKAVHVTGQVGSATGPAVRLDMQFQGQQAKGTVTVAGATVAMVKTGGKLFLQAPQAFWAKTAGPKAGSLSGKWIKVDARKVAGLGNLTLQGIAASLNASDAPLQPKTTTATVDGRRAIVVTQKDGSKLYVADSDRPVPLRIVSSERDKASGSVTFTGYGTTRDIKPPAGAMTPQQALRSGGVHKT